MRPRFLAALASLTMLAVAVPATAYAADRPGDKGTIVKVEVNSPSADTYLQYHGRVFVKSKKSNTEYRWGGTSCGSKTINADLVDMLVQGVRDNDDIIITPSYQTGQGDAKCLVGFTFKNKR